MERYELPDGWEWRELAQVLEIGSEQVNPFRFPDDLFNYLALENIEQGSGKVIDFTPTPGKNIKSNKFKFTSKHVLYGKLRPYLRKAFAPDFEGVSATDLLPLLPDENSLDRKFLVWWLLSPQVIEYVVGKQAGVKMPRLRSNDLAQMPIPIPILTEQQRIVAKIESLFEQSRAARTALTRVPVLMWQFRRAVLASATSGRLAEEWREMHPDAPEHRLVSLREVAKEFRYGTSTKSQKTGEVPVLRMGNIQDRKLDWNDLVFTSDKSEIEKYKLTPGDVLFNRTNSPELVGKTAIYNGERPAIYAGYLIKVKCSDALLPDYLNYCLNSPAGRDWASQVKSDGVSQSNINAQKLANFEFDLPPIEEQTEIVQRVEKMFAQADIINQAASASLRRAEQVDQSILARAFRGELG